MCEIDDVGEEGTKIGPYNKVLVTTSKAVLMEGSQIQNETQGAESRFITCEQYLNKRSSISLIHLYID